MKTFTFLLCSSAALAWAAPKAELGGIGPRAGALTPNCDCQCSPLMFMDKNGKVQGNCQSTDKTGAQWCYVDPENSDCVDLKDSVRFTLKWSYEACATPAIDSTECNDVDNGIIPRKTPKDNDDDEAEKETGKNVDALFFA